MRSLVKGGITAIILFTCFTANSQQIISTPQFRKEFLDNINYTRQKGCTCGIKYMRPVLPLIWNDNLEVAAMEHATDMYNRNYFSHDSKDGRSMEDRIVFAGYLFKGYKSFSIGENIAMGQQSIAEVMRGWFKSEGHCKNLMSPTFKEVGVAVNNAYWVQDFGGRESFSDEQQKLIKSGKYRLIEKTR